MQLVYRRVILICAYVLLSVLGYGFECLATSGNPESDAWWFGCAYNLPEDYVEISPFLFNRKLEGSIIFNGREHKNQIFFVDLSIHKVVLNTKIGNEIRNIALTTDLVEEVRFWNNNQEYVLVQNGNRKLQLSNVPSGFFKIVNGKQLKILEFRDVTGRTPSFQDRSRFDYLQETSLYLVKDQKGIDISSKRKLYAAFKPIKKDLKIFLKQQGIIYPTLAQNELMKILTFCECETLKLSGEIL